IHRPLHRSVRTIAAPLFPGYVFCNCDDSALQKAWSIPGVLSTVCHTDSANAVTAQTIHDLQRVVSSGLPYQRWPFTPGQLMKVEQGPLRGIHVVRIDPENERWFVVSIN